MHPFFYRFIATALLVGGLTPFVVHAQRAAPGLTPHADLSATLSSSTAGAAITPVGPFVAVQLPPAPGQDLFNDPPPAEGGWKALARLLDAASPSVDTSIPLTPSQVTDRISSMMDQGRYAAALDLIEQRMQQRQAELAMGYDVQLLFLRGRALAGLERHNEAIEHYLNMTSKFPELPEPWNNLAVEYVKQGKLDMAADALNMALAANPQFAAAKANMGWVQLMQAQRAFESAAGQPGAGKAAKQTSDILRNP